MVGVFLNPSSDLRIIITQSKIIPANVIIKLIEDSLVLVFIFDFTFVCIREFPTANGRDLKSKRIVVIFFNNISIDNAYLHVVKINILVALIAYIDVDITILRAFIFSNPSVDPLLPTDEATCCCAAPPSAAATKLKRSSKNSMVKYAWGVLPVVPG